MGSHDVYRFQAIPQAALGPGDSRDPFRFYSDATFQPNPQALSQPAFDLEVQDADGNRRLDEKDLFVYADAQGKRIALRPEEGLKLLNYYADPELLKSKGLGLVVTRQSPSPAERLPNATLDSIPQLSAEEKEAIRDTHFPYWEVDGHLDLDILEGVRIFTQQENERWTGIEGVPIYLNWRYLGNRVLLEKGGVALSFVGLEHLVGAPFVWQTYTTNYLSMVQGAVSNNSRREGRIEAGFDHSDGEVTSSATRRMINIQTAKARSEISQEHLYFHVTWPIVLAACAADPAFRKFVYAPGRGHLFGNLFRYFGGQFSRALPAMGRNPFALGLAAVSGYGIYQLSAHWYELYGHLPQGSTENRLFSSVTTLFAEAALYNRASREMELLTGATRVNFGNMMALRRAPFRMSLSYEWVRGNFFGAKIPYPRPGLYATWTETASVEALLERRYAVAGMRPMGAAAFEGATILTRRELVSRLMTGESLLAQRAGLSVASRLALPAAEEELMMAEKILLRSRVRSVGLPLLGAAALLGAGVGLYYLLKSPEDRE